MKKWIALLMAVLLCISLCACGEKEPDVLGEEISGGMSEEHIAMVEEGLKAFKDTDFYKNMEDDPTTEAVESGISIEKMMYYRADGAVEGIDLNVLLIGLVLNADVCGWNRIVVMDLRDGALYNTQMLDMANYAGSTDSYEDLMKMALGGYDNVLNGRSSTVMTEMEVRTPATAEQIAVLNAALSE